MADIHPDLTEEDLKNGTVIITEPSGTGSLSPGDIAHGEITDTQIDEVEWDGDVIFYLNFTIEIEDAFEADLASYPLNGGRINEGTRLGAVADRFNGGLEELRGGELNFADFFEGESVSFIYDEDDEGFARVGFDTDGQPALYPHGEVPDDIEPDLNTNGSGNSGSDEPDTEAQKNQSDEDPETRVVEIVSENEGESKSKIMKEMGKKPGSSELIQAFKDMLDDGTLEDNDGIEL